MKKRCSGLSAANCLISATNYSSHSYYTIAAIATILTKVTKVTIAGVILIISVIHSNLDGKKTGYIR